MHRNAIFFGLLLSLGIVLARGAVEAAEPMNRWLGKTADWADASNWSAGAAPAGDRAEDVLIEPASGRVDPVLAKDAAVGGSLRIASGARLGLNGRHLEVGGAIARNTAAPAGENEGLRIEKNAAVVSEGGRTATVTLRAGGLVNLGRVDGKISLRIAGAVRALAVDAGKALELAELTLEPSPFPYPVVASGKIVVAGNLELAGGRLVVKPAGDASPSKFAVRGDLVFRGGSPCVMLVTEGDLLVYGTIKSEGSAFCVETAGDEKVWNRTDNAAYCYCRDNAGWVCMVGEGDQTITPGGILPALRIAKPTGKVTVTSDLHCNGLHVARGNTLDLSKGQRLILGHHLREWARNPQRNAVPEYGPCRTSRDLTSEGTILGTPHVPILFHLNVKGVRYAVQCAYVPPGLAGGPGAAGLLKAASAAAPGSLAINRYESRLRLIDGTLLLDGKPCSAAATGPKTAAPRERSDAVLEHIDSSRQGDQLTAGKAMVTKLVVTTVVPEFQPPDATPANVARMVDRIATPGRLSTVFAVNGPFWGARDVYGAVDGDPDVGTGGAAYYEFVFAEPVTVGAVRLRTGTSLASGCQFAIHADTTGSGVCDEVLAWARDGIASDGQSWLAWGTSWAAFAPRKVWRLRLEVLSADGAVCRPAINEFEIFAGKDAARRLAARPDMAAPEPLPAQAQFLTRGQRVEVPWPPAPPENRVCRIASIAFWMAGITWGTATDESAYAKLPPLREYPPCVKFLDEVKERFRFDAVQIFFEGESVGFPWPTVHFRSALNANYLARRAAALKVAGPPKPKQEGDGIDAILDGASKRGDTIPRDSLAPGGGLAKYPATLRPEDLPCQRNLLKELCEAAHAKGLAVYMLCRPEDIDKLYTGPRDQDPYEVFLKESAAGGVDGVSLVPDEEHPLWSCSGTPRWRQFDDDTRDARKNFTPLETKRWIQQRSEVAALCMTERKENVRKVKPDCRFIVDGARLLNGGDPYDVIWHATDPDYVGCSYQSHLVPRWAATSRNRRVAMGEYTHRSVRYNLESLLLGARMIRSYRYNYITQTTHSEDHRRRENLFIEQFMRWGGTRPTRAPTALLVSRASEAWWPADCRSGAVPSGNPDRCWIIEEIVYEFLLKNGYTFDVYYLDQVEDLARLKDYRLVVLPFAYSVPRAAMQCMVEAYQAGGNFLVCERKGDVDELGRPYERPLLEEWIAQGSQAGRIACAQDDLAELENSRGFVPKMAGMVDPLLGKHKNLVLKRHGNRIEAVVAAVSSEQQYVSFINWEDKESRIEAGLNLPAGQYKVLTLSSVDPEAIREGLVAGQKTLSAESLRQFAIKLDADEALSLYVAPAGQPWGQR